MNYKPESLSKKERAAQDAFIATLANKKRKTKRQQVVALVGLVGSGKSSVAREFAKLIGGTIVEADAIRVELRKRKEVYDNARVIGENATAEVLRRGGNVVLDSDFGDPDKRAGIAKTARAMGAELVLVRTQADADVMFGRMLSAPYRGSSEDFFGGAATIWRGSAQSKGAVVKIREMWRRTPHHYAWENKSGGRWVAKKLPFPVAATIDTTDEKKWKGAVAKYAKKLLKN